jgi:hypothetical protein
VTEQTGNSVLKATTHHADSGEDQAAETDDSARVYGEGLERPHEGLRPGEIHRALCMGDVSNAREGERDQSRPYDARCLEEVSFGEGLGQSLGKVGCLAGDDGADTVKHWHLPRPSRPRFSANAIAVPMLKSNDFSGVYVSQQETTAINADLRP